MCVFWLMKKSCFLTELESKAIEISKYWSGWRHLSSFVSLWSQNKSNVNNLDSQEKHMWEKNHLAVHIFYKSCPLLAGVVLPPRRYFISLTPVGQTSFKIFIQPPWKKKKQELDVIKKKKKREKLKMHPTHTSTQLTQGWVPRCECELVLVKSVSV